jgi:flagellar assembly factor FliW
MLVKSTRFGSFSVSQEDVIYFPGGLIGFENTRHWLILADPGSPDVVWLQATTKPHLALPLISPRKFLPDYKVSLSQRQVAALQLRNTDRLFVMLVLSKTGKTLTANLRGPILINLTGRLAIQTVASDALPLALPLVQGPTGSLRVAA